MKAQQMRELSLFAIVGKPVIYSKSPEMHNAAFSEAGIDAVYTRLAAEDAKDALRSAKELGMKGLNVTAPFKEDFLKLVDKLHKNAKQAGAVNTVIISKGKTNGFNTDINGVAGALLSNGSGIRGKKAVVIGAGGAAKAAVSALVEGGVEVTIANRTMEKAKPLAKKFHCKYSSLEISELEKIIPDADIIVSCITSTARIIPEKLLRKDTVVFDANYSAQSALVRDAKKKGCRLIDGREWLLHQGVSVFERFTGKKAPEEVMRKAICNIPGSGHGKKPNIALIGFMGSGKSSVAREIGRRAKMSVMDIDESIEKNTGASIREIFEREGEVSFRMKERKEIAGIKNASNSVIACGGGAVLNQANVKILKDNCMVVWLFASPKTIFKRIANDHLRPLLNARNREEIARRMMAARLPLYTGAADIVVSTERKNAAAVAKVILDEINNAV